jgi:ssDNA-binding Zn-finger/Zn-ribbon topoisomerase 1
MPVSKAILDDLFETKLPRKAAAEDISLRDEAIGLGFPNERFDLMCPECGLPMRLRTSKHGLFYGCTGYPTCKACHGAYNDGRPKGTPGDKDTRRARVFAHRIFDRLWKKTGEEKARMTRAQAYAWMRKALKLSESEAHIGMLTTEQCQKLVAAIYKKFPGVRNVWDKLAGDKDLF